MTAPTPRSEEEFEARQAAEIIVEQRIQSARKKEIVSLYSDLLQTIWGRLVPTLGRVTVVAILERAVAETSRQFPFLANLEITSQGLSSESLLPAIKECEPDQIRAAMKELVASLINILAVLTGDIIVRRLLAEMQNASPVERSHASEPA